MSGLEENHQAIIARGRRRGLLRRVLGMLGRADPPRAGGSIFPHFDVNAPMPAPPNAPRGGPIETPFPGRVTIVPKDHVLIPEPPPVPAPIVGYVSQNGLRIFEATDSWSTTLYRDPRDLAPRGGIVEVEIRFLRVVEA